jgi:hypothetical protein
VQHHTRAWRKRCRRVAARDFQQPLAAKFTYAFSDGFAQNKSIPQLTDVERVFSSGISTVKHIVFVNAVGGQPALRNPDNDYVATIATSDGVKGDRRQTGFYVVSEKLFEAQLFAVKAHEGNSGYVTRDTVVAGDPDQ